MMRAKHSLVQDAIVTVILSLVLRATIIERRLNALITLGDLIVPIEAQQLQATTDHLPPGQPAELDSNKLINQLASAAAAASTLTITSPLLLASQATSNQTIDSLLANVLDRIGPDIKPTSGHRDSPDITVELSRRAWQLMHDHAQVVVDKQVASVWPQIEQLLLDSSVSLKCLQAARETSLAASRLDAWAIQLLNSWGKFPPAGMFEGTLGDIGSFHGCVNVAENPTIGHAHYCTLAYRPVMPTRRDFELIIRQEPSELLNMFDGNDAFGELIRKAQYNHYVYYKVGTCFPIDCSPRDVQRVAKLMGRRAVLMSGPVKCHSKYGDDYQTPDGGSGNGSKQLHLSSQDLNNGVYIWRPHVTSAQRIALLALGSLVVVIVAVTLTDLMINRLPKLSSTSPSPQPAGQSIAEMSTKATIKDNRVKQLEEDDLNNNNNNNNDIDDNSHEHFEQIKLHSIKSKTTSDRIDIPTNTDDDDGKVNSISGGARRSTMFQLINDCSLITNTKEFFLIGASQHKNDILCINGMRCITMSWIIIAHTMQYNDWSAFARIYEIEVHLKSLINQPLFNASYLVDTFFLISGLLTSFSAFRTFDLNDGDDSAQEEGEEDSRYRLSQDCSANNNCGNMNNRIRRQHKSIKEILTRFSCRTYLIGRYLRLTPQILLVSLMFIVLPLVLPSGGPHWYSMTGEYSENCSKNWWVNLLHIQAFYRSDEMCNFVCWWISVDMFYHLFALIVILTIFRYGHKISLKLCSTLMLLTGLWQASKHYQMGLPPNLLSTIPQTGAMWSQTTLGYFWRPEAHTFPFLFGFYLGFLMAQHEAKLRRLFTMRTAAIGWLVTLMALASVSFGTYPWIIGKYGYTNTIATCYYLTTQIVWSLCLSYIILACHYDHGGFINQILSCKLFIILGKASYIVYLSHFLILFTFFGSQNLLLEPTQMLMLYVIIGNICLSMMFGSFLCIAFEMPWLKLQKRIMRRIR